MWVRYFQHRKDEAVYQDFVTRYHQFIQCCLVQVCGDHHEEIHELYWKEIYRWIDTHKPYHGDWFEEWTYDEANRLMDHLRGVCDDWIKRPTPGRKRRKYTGRE